MRGHVVLTEEPPASEIERGYMFGVSADLPEDTPCTTPCGCGPRAAGDNEQVPPHSHKALVARWGAGLARGTRFADSWVRGSRASAWTWVSLVCRPRRSYTPCSRKRNPTARARATESAHRRRTLEHVQRGLSGGAKLVAQRRADRREGKGQEGRGGTTQ